MGLSEWHNEDSYKPIRWLGVTPGALISAVFFGLFVTGFLLLVGWFVITAPTRTEIHVREGREYICRYYPNEIKCELYGDPDVGYGRVE